MIKKEAPEGGAVVLTCGTYCDRTYCGCRRTDWYWTDEKRPWYFVTDQIWARFKGQSFHLNSVCHDDLERSTLLKKGFELEIAPVARTDDGRTFCCYSGEIQTGSPLLFCTSLIVKGEFKIHTRTWFVYLYICIRFIHGKKNAVQTP